jgi:hypothetical protein
VELTPNRITKQKKTLDLNKRRQLVKLRAEAEG